MFPFGELKQILWGKRKQEQFQCNVPQLSNDLPQMKWMSEEIILWLWLVSNHRGWLKANVTSFPLSSLFYIFYVPMNIQYWLIFSLLPFKPFNSHKWLTYNFFLQYSYLIQQTGNESTQTYHVEVVILI